METRNYYFSLCGLFLSIFWLILSLTVSAAADTDEASVSIPVIPLPVEWQPPQLIIFSTDRLPVRLDSVSIHAEIHGNQALSRVELTFFNPNPQILEGELQFPLLAGQQVVGLAMDVNGHLREAVPVEKAKGKQVFEDVIRQKIDPALLEVTKGNNYKLRVYPIPANGAKRVVFRILETLPTRDGHLKSRWPLAYAEKLATISLTINVFGNTDPVVLSGALEPLLLARKGEVYQATFTQEQYQGRDVVELQIPTSNTPVVSCQLYKNKKYFRAEIPLPPVTDVPRSIPKQIQLLWDASGSAAGRDQGRILRLLDRYFSQMNNGEVELVVFRDTPEHAKKYPVKDGDWSQLRTDLETVVYDGASRFDLLPKSALSKESILVSDGLMNYGLEQFPDLAAPVFTLSSSSGSDTAALSYIAEHSGGRFIDLSRFSDDDAAALFLTQSIELVALSGIQLTDLVQESRFAIDGRFLMAGISTGNNSQLKVTFRLPDNTLQVIDLNIPAQANSSLAALSWAQLRLQELDGERKLHRAEIRRIGKEFHIPTAETSLIILDRVEDYVEHEIEPPQELHEQYALLTAQSTIRKKSVRKSHVEQVVAMFQDKVAWWQRTFPKGNPPEPKKIHKGASSQEESDSAGVAEGIEMRRRQESYATPATQTMQREMGRAAHIESMDSAIQPARPNSISTNNQPATIAINLKKWTSDAPYIDRFQEANTEDLYSIYLDERPDHLNSSAFYLDAAESLFVGQQRNLGLRVLSNLAEMNLENRHLLRILAYRLLERDQAQTAIPLLKQVLSLAPYEPQSYRDLGLAYAAAGQLQLAVNTLYEVVERTWDSRFSEVELIVLAELNSLIATAGTSLDTSAIDPRLLQNLPLDLRVVLTWDADNSDMDLWVIDPNGEKCYYGHRATYQGGRMSLDFIGGYGPEEFSLKDAKPGKYLVQAQFYGHRGQVVSKTTTLQLRLFTHFGSEIQNQEAMTLRLAGSKEVVTVGEFIIEKRGGLMVSE